MSNATVLFFAADPFSAPPGGGPRLQLDADVRLIRQKVRAGIYRDSLVFDYRLAARADDLIQVLNEISPQVVHFSGHGSSDGLALEGMDGGAHLVPPAALEDLFRVFRGDIQVVVLNACLSVPQAQAIAAVIGCVIGTGREISDEAAMTFSASFYRALAFGRSVQAAFDQAHVALKLEHPREAETPQIIAGPGVDPAQIFPVRGPFRGGSPQNEDTLVARLDVDPERLVPLPAAESGSVARGSVETDARPPTPGSGLPPSTSTRGPKAAQSAPEATDATAEVQDQLQNAFALLQEAVRSMGANPGKPIPAEYVKRRMREMSPEFDEHALGFGRFSRFLRKAHEASVVDLRRTDKGEYEVSLPSGGRILPPPVLPAPTLLYNEHPVLLGDATTTPAGHPVNAAGIAEDAPPDMIGDDPREAVPMHGDEPATVDQLQRRPFAEVVGARMDEIRGTQHAPSGEGGAFMVHVHGPWGSGKTSVLNFLRAYLQDGKRSADQRWVVIDFNAWRHQRIRPPWWSLLREVYTQAARQLGIRRSLWLRAQWLWWRFRADWVPAAAALLLILVTVSLTIGAVSSVLSGAGAPPPGSSGGSGDGTAKNIELALKILTALFAAGGAVLAASRSLVFGSSSAAQAYASLRSDPLSPIVRLFQKVVRAAGRPVAVFVDDLDRCDGTYVVELLEGIQTLFRTAPVTYVVAADRKWICSSFENGYGDFGGVIGEPGRPLGYLFLDKIFQVSASVPRPSPEVRAAYWKDLLRAAGSGDPTVLDAARRKAEARAEEKMGPAHTQEELEAKIAEAAADPRSGHLEAQAMRAAAARRITAPEARLETEHRLQRFSPLLEPNPRSMKRLVNAFGLHQATHFLEGRSVTPDALARWTIMELRWPLLADYLAARPQAAADLVTGKAPADGRLGDELKALFEDPAVLAVVLGTGEEGAATLNPAAVREIVGALGTSPAAGGPKE